MSRLLVVGVMSLFAFLHVPSTAQVSLQGTPYLSRSGYVIFVGLNSDDVGDKYWGDILIRNRYSQEYNWVDVLRERDEFFGYKPVSSGTATRVLGLCAERLGKEEVVYFGVYPGSAEPDPYVLLFSRSYVYTGYLS